MKNGIKGLLGTIAICAAIIAVVFGLLGGLIDLDFAITIAYFAGAVLAMSVYVLIVLWVVSFDWTESPFLKMALAGILLAVLNYIIYAIFDWQLFYIVFIICAVATALAVVIGVIKAIFGNS